MRFLKRETNDTQAPFFLGCGFFRPHLPWYVPRRFFDRYPIDEIVLPAVRDDDQDDLPLEGLKFARARHTDFDVIRDAKKWKHAVQAYLASITCVDDRIGRLLDALDESPRANNTIIVLWSDHGWHLGEKHHWHKSTLWEEATRVPLIISVPGYEPGTCDRTVSLLDLYPTLNEVANFEQVMNLDGHSLVPLLENPNASRAQPAVIEFKRGNVAIRSARFRYIRYRDGGEELYDHAGDPHEWRNLASDARFADTKTQLGKWDPCSLGGVGSDEERISVRPRRLYVDSQEDRRSDLRKNAINRRLSTTLAAMTIAIAWTLARTRRRASDEATHRR